MRDVIGQQRLLARLGPRAVRGDVAHAYGLFGPRGIGKRTVALRLAQTLECASGVAGGCGACLSCRKVERGIHPDVRIVTRAADKKDIALEQIREMQEDLALRPLEGPRRVVVIDDASELNQFGQDALLKTLEEPPRHAVLLVVTTTPAALHDTIRSRVQPLDFRLVPAAEIAAGLTARGIKDAERHAAASGGRPGIAIALATGDPIRAERERLEAELYRLVASGLTDRFAWAADLADEGDPRKRAEAIDTRLAHWSELLRDAALAARGDASRPLRPSRSGETQRLAASVSADDLLGAALLSERIRRDLAWNANARMMLELIALRLPYSAAVKAA